MKVVLRDDVATLGHKGDVVDVADGYARNYLVPRGLALRASAGVVAQGEAMRRSRAAREARDRDAATEVAGRLAARTLTVRARAGESGKLFGSVTSADIAEAVMSQFGVEVDRRRIDLDDPIRELGEVDVPVRLHAEVVATLHVEVAAE